MSWIEIKPNNISPQPVRVGALFDLEVLREGFSIEELSSSRAGAILLKSNQTDGVFDSQLIIHGEVSEFEQFNGVINDRGLVMSRNTVFVLVNKLNVRIANRRNAHSVWV